jgi:hypothetical protein
MVGVGVVAKLYNEGTTYAFFDRMLSKFGVPTKVLTKQGMELCGDFQKLCEKALINHWTTSLNHLEADGLTFTTLALGSRPRQGLAKVWAKNEAQESHSMLPGM